MHGTPQVSEQKKCSYLVLERKIFDKKATRGSNPAKHQPATVRSSTVVGWYFTLLQTITTNYTVPTHNNVVQPSCKHIVVVMTSHDSWPRLVGRGPDLLLVLIFEFQVEKEDVTKSVITDLKMVKITTCGNQRRHECRRRVIECFSRSRVAHFWTPTASAAHLRHKTIELFGTPFYSSGKTKTSELKSVNNRTASKRQIKIYLRK